MSSGERRRSPRLLELEAKKKENPTCHVPQDASCEPRRKKVRNQRNKNHHGGQDYNFYGTYSNLRDRSVQQTMPKQEIGNSYPTNPLSGSSMVSAPWNTSSNLSGKSVPEPDQHTVRSAFMNVSCGDGNPNNRIPSADGKSLMREYEKTYGVSPSSPGLWNYPVQLAQPDRFKLFHQQGGNISSSGSNRRILELKDIDEWLRPCPNQGSNSGVRSDNSVEKSTDQNKMFPWTLQL